VGFHSEMPIKMLRRVVRQLQREAASVTALTLNLAVIWILLATASTLLWRAPAGITHAEELFRVVVWYRTPTGLLTHGESVSQIEASIIANASSVVADAATYSCSATTLAYGTQATGVTACQVSPSYFRTLGISRGAVGQLLDSSIARGQPTAVVLSIECWHRLFPSDTLIIGRTVDLGGTTMIIVGIAPDGFRGLDGEVVDLWTTSAAWREGGEVSAAIAAADPNFRSRTAVLRLRGHLNREAAAHSLNAYYANRAAAADVRSVGRLELQTLLPGVSLRDSIPARIGLWALVLLVLSVGSTIAGALDLGALASLREARHQRLRWMMGAGRARLIQSAVSDVVITAGAAIVVAVALSDLSWHLFAHGWLGRQVAFGEFMSRQVLTLGATASLIAALALLFPRMLAATKATSYLPGIWQQHVDLPTHATVRAVLLSTEVAIFVLVSSTGPIGTRYGSASCGHPGASTPLQFTGRARYCACPASQPRTSNTSRRVRIDLQWLTLRRRFGNYREKTRRQLP